MRNLNLLSTILLALFLVSGIQLFAATEGNKLDISTDVPVAITVCQDTGLFVTTIKNISTDFIEAIEVRPNFPGGINYVAGTLTGGFGTAELDVDSPIFSIDSIPIGDSVIIAYQATASCDIIPQVLKS